MKLQAEFSFFRGKDFQDMKDGEKSFAKIFEILELIASSRDGLKGREISGMTRIPQSTVFRMLKFLTERGYLVKQEQRYCLGAAISRLGSLAANQNPLIRIAHPVLAALAERTHETVHLARMENARVVYIDKVEGVRSVRMGSMIGKSSPLYCTGVGKAMLAFLPERERGAVIRSIEFTAFTENTITTADALEKELAEIRQKGYAVDDCEHERGVYCVAAPVTAPDGSALCALSVSGSELYLREQTLSYASLLRDAAREIAAML